MASSDIPFSQHINAHDSSVSGAELRRMTLMIVDDSATNMQAMKTLLENEYQLVMFDNAGGAIDHALEENVDLILLNVTMPDMDGHQVCKILKSSQLTAHIPIIIVTSSQCSEEEARGLLLGAVDYVVKPLNLTTLRVRLRNQMELVYYRKKAELLACVDGLTGVLNRLQLDSMLLQHFYATIRFGRCMALLIIDVDNLKSYNEWYGHLLGDDCLKRVATAVQTINRRETDSVGRYGGDQFALVLTDTNVRGASLVAKKLLDHLHSLNLPHPNNAPHNIVTVSIGIAVFTVDQQQNKAIVVDDLVHRAEQKLLQAKQAGKNQFCCEAQTPTTIEHSIVPDRGL